MEYHVLLVIVALLIAAIAVDAKQQRCGELAYMTNVPMGHKYCARMIPIGFHTCTLVLLDSTVCDALSYTNGRCTVLARSDEATSSPPTNGPAVSMKRLTRGIDECSVDKYIASDQFDISDMNMEVSASWYQLPLLGLVMTVTKDWMQANHYEVKAVMSNFQCYAKAHNYTFHLHVMEATHRSRFYHVRHISAANTYLHRYKYLLMLDADNLVFNLSRPLTEVLALPSTPTPTHPHVILHMRDGGEATASTFILRNSQYSRRFLEWWRDMAPPTIMQSENPTRWISTPNHDNGDLVALLMTLMNRDVFLKCVSHIKSVSPSTPSMEAYDRGVLLCFRLFRGAFAEDDQREIRGQVRRLPQVRLFFTRESFFTMHTGHVQRDVSAGANWNGLLQAVAQPDGLRHPFKDTSCSSSDVIGHGMKSIGRVYWPSATTTCDVAHILKGHGANEMCRWLSKEEELIIARHFCFWRSPICREGGTNHGNKCIDYAPLPTNSSNLLDHRVHKCDLEKFNMQRWSLCVRHHLCNPYITYRHFKKNITAGSGSRGQQMLKLATPWIT